MKTVGDKIEAFSVTGVKPGFNEHEENGQSAFETITEQSFPGKWKIIYTYPKDFTFVCPTEIAGFAKLAEENSDDKESAKKGGEYATIRRADNYPATPYSAGPAAKDLGKLAP